LISGSFFCFPTITVSKYVYFKNKIMFIKVTLLL